MYRFILFMIVVFIIILLYNYTSEPFQNIDASGNIQQAQAQIDTILHPLIQANPDLSDVFNGGSKGIDLSKLDINAIRKKFANVVPTAVDTRPMSNIGRQCDIFQEQLLHNKELRTNYTNTSSWDLLRSTNKTIAELEKHISDLGC